MAKRLPPTVDDATYYRNGAKTAVGMIGAFINAKRRPEPAAFPFQLSPQGIKAAEHHLGCLLLILDADALAPSVTPADRAAADSDFQQFLAVQGIKEARHA